MTPADFKLGTYRHYKGDLYTAIGLVTHHETRLPMVLYVSHKYGWVNCRPLHGWAIDEEFVDAFEPRVYDRDGFLDEVTWPDGRVAPRFELVTSASEQTDEPRCYGCGGPLSAHGKDGRSMTEYPQCRQFRGERPSWYPAGKGIEER